MHANNFKMVDGLTYNLQLITKNCIGFQECKYYNQFDMADDGGLNIVGIMRNLQWGGKLSLDRHGHKNVQCSTSKYSALKFQIVKNWVGIFSIAKTGNFTVSTITSTKT